MPFFSTSLPYSLLSFSKGLFLAFFLSVLSTVAYAQIPNRTPVPPPPLPIREVSGIVKDSIDVAIPGVTVKLTSEKDTLVTSTNEDGIFIFKGVKSASYTMSFSMISFKPYIGKYKQNDAVARIVMDPIILKDMANMLEAVVINGTPSITYKTDTVEYKASDYIVRKNASVDELLKKMEGMEVSNKGTLTHNGEEVVRAKVNGKEFLGGEVAKAIKNLPAEIVDRIQIVDDYGDQAARTGVKDGTPEKILNITTRTDKSVGNMLAISGSAGNNDRYDLGFNGIRLNGNQQIGLDGQLSNSVLGVGGSTSGRGGGGGGSGGTTSLIKGGFSVSDRSSKKLEYNFSYLATSNDVNSLNSSFSESVTNLKDQDGNTILEKTFSTRGNESNSDDRKHTLKGDISLNLDSNNFLRIQPSINLSSSITNRADSVFQTGFRHQNQISANVNKNTTPKFGLTLSYHHRFTNKRRNFSMQVEGNQNNQEADQLQDMRIRYFLNEEETLVKDSLVNRIISRKNLQQYYRASLTYVEPLTVNTQFELNTQIAYNGYDNKAITQNTDQLGVSNVIDSLSNIYAYSFTQARIALNFRYGVNNTSKVRFSAGITGVPAVLSGTKQSLGTSTNRNSFNLIPIARFEYVFSRQHRVSINYAGAAAEPNFDQIQPVRDVTNPNNPVIGNPSLRATFTHTIKTEYNNYLANSKLNYSLNLNASFIDNAVVRNSINIIDPNIPVPPGGVPVRITETRFQNMNGVYRFNGNYSVSKQLNNRKYNLSLNGSANYDHRITMSNGVVNVNNVLTFEERFGPRINPTTWLEINPYISHTSTRSTNSVLKNENLTNTLAMQVDGRIDWKMWNFNFNASKNYVSGINANVSKNPFIVNAAVEKLFFNARGKLSIQAFDLFNQNNFINRDINDSGGYTDTKSNALSRFFMLSASMTLNKWTGAKPRKGSKIMRRGDGSFY